MTQLLYTEQQIQMRLFCCSKPGFQKTTSDTVWEPELGTEIHFCTWIFGEVWLNHSIEDLL
jgi:hypothetical protein